jgi:hypothetical protein
MGEAAGRGGVGARRVRAQHVLQLSKSGIEAGAVHESGIFLGGTAEHALGEGGAASAGFLWKRDDVGVEPDGAVLREGKQ